MLKKIRDFYQKEYEITKQEVAKISLFSERNQTVWGAIHRNLGVAYFHMNEGYDNDIEKLYNEYRQKLLELLK